MSRQSQIPGSAYLNETNSRQAQVPGGAFVNQTISTTTVVHPRGRAVNSGAVSGSQVRNLVVNAGGV